MQKWILPPACSYHGLHRILSSYLLAHFYLRKCCSILVLIAGCWNSLLTSCNPKNNWCLSRIFGTQVGGKDRGLITCKPWSKQAGGWTHFCRKRLRTLNSYQIFKIKNKKQKHIAVDVLFKALPRYLLFMPFGGRGMVEGRIRFVYQRWHTVIQYIKFLCKEGT
jgi:hypothetical protein